MTHERTVLVDQFDRRAPPLTAEERDRAEQVGVYRIDAHRDDTLVGPGSFLAAVAVGLTKEEAWNDVQALGDRRRAEWEDFRTSGPWLLAKLHEYEVIDANAVRALLRRVQKGEHYERSAPLTPEERERAEKMKVYYIWYEDKFHYGGDRDSYAVAICLTREEAETEAQRRGGPAEPMGSGYEVLGPLDLLDATFRSHARGAEVVREVLKRIDADEPGPIPIPVEMW